MMAQDETFGAVMARLRTGEDRAADVILKRFTRRLIALARKKLRTISRAEAEIEDVVQSVYKSFFARHGQGQFELDDWNAVWGLLTIITLRKCANRRTYHLARRRDVRREVAWQGTGRSSRSEPGWDLIDREPTPFEAAALAETVGELFRGLEDPDRQTVTMLLQGYTALEIATIRSCSERTVRRVRSRVKDRLKRLLAIDVETSAE
jgi:RNA polymerase sigma-70 factor, ECF subfamily